MQENDARERIAALGRSLFGRSLTFGSSGNISVRLDDGWLMTPTGSRLDDLDPARLSRLDAEGRHTAGDKPTKESFLHLAMYRERADAGAVVHLHSTHSVAVSCLADLDPDDVLPPITAYYIMRVGRLGLIPYYPPGDTGLADAVRGKAAAHHALLLANHGPVVSGRSLGAAADAIEELEETAKLFLLLRHQDGMRPLTGDQVAELRQRFPT